MEEAFNITTGFIRKLKGILPEIGSPVQTQAAPTGQIQPMEVQYFLPIGSHELHLNPLLGKTLSLSFDGSIQCIACGTKTKKSYQQGYCFPCTQKLAQCDLCIVRPERCHYHLGTCREPDWAESHCMMKHIVYIANTSGLKVGITRETQIPTRWIDQGAIQALPIARVATRYQAGLVEVSLAEHFADKTDWRKMLKGEAPQLNLEDKRKEVMSYLSPNNLKSMAPTVASIETISEKSLDILYPILEFPSKIQSINLEKTPNVSGVLMGIKGQYLIFDCGVINIRNIAGFNLTMS